MDNKTFNALLGLLAAAIGMKPEDIIGWFQEMSRHYTSDHSAMAEYLSMVLAPCRPQLFILADKRRKTWVFGGSGTPPKDHNYKVEFAPEFTTIGNWFHPFRRFFGDELVIPQSVISIEESAFEFTDFKRISFETRVIELPSSICCGCKQLTEVHLPETIERIGRSAFRFCENLTDINIPDSVHTIGELAFESCNALPEETKAKILEIGGPEAFFGGRGEAPPKYDGI